MRVGMDISQLAHFGGVATYTFNLSLQLSKFDDLEMVYFYSSLRKPYQGNLKNVKMNHLPPTLFEMIFNRWRNIGIEQFIGPVDIFHSSDWTQPPSKAKKVTTYHDVVPIKYPEWSHPKVIAVHKRRLKLVEEEVDCVIAVSKATKQDLLETTKIPEEKIKVIYEGPTTDFKLQSEENIRKFKEKYKLPEKFVLAIGGVGERKNIDRIEAASKEYPLIVTGHSIPWLNTEELELLYQSAAVLVYASLYEGFGLPILDAFCLGLPVITSNTSSMPEVGGDSALYIDPLNVEDINKKINLVMKDLSLRKEMINKGFKQAKKFSWEKNARQTVEVYRRLLK